MKKRKIILIGAGDRGTVYATEGKMSCPDFEIVAVADRDPVRRNYIREMFQIPDELCFDSWEAILSKPKMADAAIIATQDHLHFAPCMKAIELGYDILLEKPIAPTATECIRIADAAKAKGVRVVVCFVLRYAPFFRLLKKLIAEGKVGKIINVVHMERIGHLSYAHHFVRGDWRNTEVSAPLALAKTCHDMDILQWLLDARCTKVQSFGSLLHFCPENKPEGSPEYCVEGCPVEKSCPYSTLRIYRDRSCPTLVRTATKKHNPTDEEIMDTITHTRYGKCVYSSDNNVVDHQVFNLAYDNGATVSFTVSAFNKGGRMIRIMGTKGELYGELKNSDHVTLYDFESKSETVYRMADEITDEDSAGGHGGGDRGIIRSFCQFLAGEYQGDSISDIETYAENHLVCFAAEESRMSDRVISMDEFKKKYR